MTDPSPQTSINQASPTNGSNAEQPQNYQPTQSENTSNNTLADPSMVTPNNKPTNSLPPLPNETTKEESKEKEEKVVEKVIVKEKVRRGGVLNTGCGCRTITCGGCFLIILLIAGFITLVFSKPESLWVRLVDFLNNDVEVYDYNEVSYETAIAGINNQVNRVGVNEIVIEEQALTSLSRRNIEGLKNLTVDVADNSLNLFWVLDQKYENHKLYGVLQFKENDKNNLYISKLGTNRVGTPQFVNTTLTNLLYRALGIGKSANEDENLFLHKLTALNEDVQIQDIEFKDNSLILKVNVGVDLFN